MASKAKVGNTDRGRGGEGRGTGRASAVPFRPAARSEGVGRSSKSATRRDPHRAPGHSSTAPPFAWWPRPQRTALRQCSYWLGWVLSSSTHVPVPRPCPTNSNRTQPPARCGRRSPPILREPIGIPSWRLLLYSGLPAKPRPMGVFSAVGAARGALPKQVA